MYRNFLFLQIEKHLQNSKSKTLKSEGIYNNLPGQSFRELYAHKLQLHSDFYVPKFNLIRSSLMLMSTM